MSSQRKKLDRLSVTDPCPSSWDQMKASPDDQTRRFCSECQRDVFDLAQMTPRQIHAHLQASRGRLCARLIHTGGRLRVLPKTPELTAFQPSRTPPRPSPLAASLVTAWLGVGAAQAQPSAPAATPRLEASVPEGRVVEVGKARTRKKDTAPDPGASLRGRVTDIDGYPIPGTVVVARHSFSGAEQTAITGANGGFTFEGLRAGLYELEGMIDGFEIRPVSDLVLRSGEVHDSELSALLAEVIITGGALAVQIPTLRSLFADSELVADVTVEGTDLQAIDDSLFETITWLRIERVFKGRVSSKRVAFRSHVYGESALASRPKPGSRALAFLVHDEEGDPDGAQPLYTTADYSEGPRVHAAEAHDAYVERLEALADLALGNGSEPGGVMEWLVATAENPHTRKEATGEISQALQDLEALLDEADGHEERTFETLRLDLERAAAEPTGSGEPPRPALLGASMSERQKQRLIRALLKTEGLDEGSIGLLELVSLWEPGVASEWFVHQLQNDEAESSSMAHLWLLEELADALGDEEVIAMAASNLDLTVEIESFEPGDADELERLRRDAVAQRRELYDRLATAIGRRQVILDPDWF